MELAQIRSGLKVTNTTTTTTTATITTNLFGDSQAAPESHETVILLHTYLHTYTYYTHTYILVQPIAPPGT